MKEQDGFGLAPDAFQKAIEEFGIWPTTVWDCDFSNKSLQKLKSLVGDGFWERIGGDQSEHRRVKKMVVGNGFHGLRGRAKRGNHLFLNQRNRLEKLSTRPGCFRKEVDDESVYGGKITESVFNPIVAIWILNLFAPKQGIVYDPFAGGGTRAICACKAGLDYVGIEIRQEEIEQLKIRFDNNNVTPRVIHCNSQNVPELKNSIADFLLTCPPYWNLEIYGGGCDDLSMAKTYKDFLSMLDNVIKESYRILKHGALSCWVVGLHREKNKGLLALNHDVAKLHCENGFIFKEEIILNQVNTGAIRRIGNFSKGNKLLIRTHEYCLIFQKGRGK